MKGFFDRVNLALVVGEEGIRASGGGGNPNIDYSVEELRDSVAVDSLGNDTVTWIILVCGLFGSLIALLVKTGGVLSFGDTMARRIHTKQQSLLTTWLPALATATGMTTACDITISTP